LYVRKLPAPEHAPLRVGTRAGRSAVLRRRAHARRLRYAGFARMFATVGVLTLAVVIYLALMSNVTRMNYDLAKRLALRTRLVDESSRLDDRIARLSSRERLGAVAARLGMGQSQEFVEVALPTPTHSLDTHGLAFLNWLK